MKKIAIIGASYLQLPLIETAKAMGCVTHVFAWAANDVGEAAADHFYPISIVEKEQILEKCREIGIDGICSIASDLAMLTVNYVVSAMGLTGNSLRCTEKSTNKHLMRKAFAENGDPSPKSALVEDACAVDFSSWHFPVIVKPTDRSGSRGITKVEAPEDLPAAIAHAKAQGFEKKALVEEFAEGQEYSVEYVSYHGKHTFLALTLKFTTGAPHFIETGHLEPAPVTEDILQRIKQVVEHALDTLEIENGASHAEIKIDAAGAIKIIEIGGRMGGDLIGSDLVRMSTGIDFVAAVIQIALGQEPELTTSAQSCCIAVRFVFSEADVRVLEKLKREHPERIVRERAAEVTEQPVTDSSNRFGYWLMQADTAEKLLPYLPQERG